MGKEDDKFSRRDFLKIAAITGAVVGLTAVGTEFFRKEKSSWPIDQETILAKIKKLNFTKGSELRTTIFFRKMMWEETQLQKMKGNWMGLTDESDWINNTSIINNSLAKLANSGIRGGRLTIVPFELTEDGKSYDWSVLETGLNMMSSHGLATDLCVGPLDYPYGPAGVRIPKKFQELLKQELTDRGKKQINISLGKDINVPESSVTIRDYAFDFLDKILRKFGKDPRVDKIYLGNEWPDAHLIEGVNATMTIDPDFMREVTNMAMKLSNKRVALNTNIYPGNLNKLKSTFQPLFSELKDRGVLGIDSYPTQEMQDLRLVNQINRYGDQIKEVKDIFSNSEVVFTELQAEPWPPEGIAGQSWAEININFFDQIVKNYYQTVFPRTLETHVQASEIREVGLWGAEIWPVVEQMNYGFPLKMLKTTSETMKKNK